MLETTEVTEGFKLPVIFQYITLLFLTVICIEVNIKRDLIIVSIILLSSIKLSAKVDSLTHLFFTSKSKETRIDAAIQLGRHYRGLELDSLKAYGLRLEQLGKPAHRKALVQGHLFQGIYHYQKSEFDSAIIQFRNQLRIAQQDNDSAQIAHALNNLGATYSNQGSSQTGIKYYRDAFRIKQEAGLEDDAMETLYNICVAMIENTAAYSEKEIDKYLRMVEKHWVNKTDRKVQLIYMYGAWSLSYSLRKIEPDSCLAYAKKALAEIGPEDEHALIYVLPSMAMAYHQKGDFKLAEETFLEALSANLKYGGVVDEVAITQLLIDLYLDLNRLDDAKKMLEKTNQLLKSLDDIRRTADNYDLWSKWYKKKQQWQNAYNALELSTQLKDSLNKKENALEIVSMRNLIEEERLEFENNLLTAERDLQKQKAEKEKARRNVFLALAMGVLVITLLLWRQYRQKNRHNQQLEEFNHKLSVSERQLQQLNAAKDKYFSILSHDLRNPLMAFESLSEKLIHDEPEQQKVTALQMHQQSVSLRSLLNNILVWSKSQQGLIEMQPTAILWRELCEEALQLYAVEANQKHILLINDVPEEILVFADKQAMYTVIRNLVGNAMKYTQSGSIHITCREEGYKVYTTISDTGCGIPADKLSNIFQLSGKQQSGLGLMLCKELTESNGGKISISSEWSKGTDVSLELPTFKFYEDSHS